MTAIVTVDAAHPRAQINRNIYGHFSEHLGRCIYGGLYVGEDSPIPNVNGMRTDVVEALKKLQVPVLRWPGGCFADEYHWRDGIGPKAARRRMVNTNWGGVVEDNSFGTHEFMELCRQIGCEAYINANVGSGTVQEMAEWVEYLNSDTDSTIAMQRRANGHDAPFHVKFWGVGNESWGCGGNMRPEYYADVYRRYQTYCRNYGEDRLYRIACGASVDDWNWTEVLMKNAGRFMDAITLHHYTVPGAWQDKGSATDFGADLYAETMRKAAYMDDLIRGHLAIMDRYDPEHRVGLIVDEWGCWHNVEPGTNPGFLYQQNTMRDAMVAALTLNIFNSHAGRVVMANLAQTVNVLQSVVLTDGADMLLTPTYHVFDLYKPHMDARLLSSCAACGEIPGGVKQLSVSASEKDGKITVTAANLSADEACETRIRLEGVKPAAVSARILAGDPHAKNTFEAKNAVSVKAFDGARLTDDGICAALPRCSVAAFEITL